MSAGIIKYMRASRRCGLDTNRDRWTRGSEKGIGREDGSAGCCGARTSATGELEPRKCAQARRKAFNL